MIDPAVERQYVDCQELLTLWRTFHDFFVMGVKGEGVSPEKEEQFLELKSRIAMLHDSFMEALTHDQNIGQEVLSIISRAITLKHLGKQSMADIKKMEIEWHESYLLLNETIGSLEDKRAELAKINEAQYKTSKALGAAQQQFVTFVTSFYFKLTVVIIAVLGATAGVQMFGIYDYKQVGKIKLLKQPYAMAMGVTHLINPDVPWVTIDTIPRKPVTSWPKGLKPELKNGDKDKTAASIPVSSITQKLKEASEYTCEECSLGFKGTYYIHVFLLKDASTAKQVESDWQNFTKDPSAQSRMKRMTELKRVTNAIIVVTSPDNSTVGAIHEIYG